MFTCTCRPALTPLASRRLLLASLGLAAAVLLGAWMPRVGWPPAASVAPLLAALVGGAALLAPVARVRWLPWASAALVGTGLLVAVLAFGQGTGVAGGVLFVALLTSAGANRAEGLAAAALLAASLVLAAAI